MSDWIENNVTTLEQSQRLADAGIELGEADAYTWEQCTLTDGNSLVDYVGNGDVFSGRMIKDVGVKRYRLDKLQHILYRVLRHESNSGDGDFFEDICHKVDRIPRKFGRAQFNLLCITAFSGVGAKAIAAAVDLLILLKTEGLLYE